MRLIMPVLLLAGLAGIPCHAADPAPNPGLRAAVERGVNWLLSKQQADGSFYDADGRQAGHHTSALTALAVLALHEAGHRASDSSAEGRSLARAATYLCQGKAAPGIRSLPDGFLGDIDGSRMYGHGMITAALAVVAPEIVGADLQKAVNDRVKEAVLFILGSQNTKKRPADAGGWRYMGISSDSDISISVWQVIALRAAADQAGATVPEEAWARAADYVKRLARLPGTLPGDARAMSYEFLDSKTDVSSTGAGARALQCCGQPHALEADECRIFIDKRGLTNFRDGWVFWGANHCSHAMIDGTAEQKTRFVKRLADALLPKQKEDGSWRADKEVEKDQGGLFVTAMAVSALSPWAGKR